MSKYISFIFLLLLFSSCNKLHEGQKILNKADSLIEANHAESALFVLQNNPQHKTRPSYDAHARILTADACYELHIANQIRPEDLDKSIDYYKAHSNKTLLARAYMSKAKLAAAQGELKEEIDLLKQAELTASKIKNVQIKETIATGLAIANAKSGNYKLALQYAHSLQPQHESDFEMYAKKYNTLACIYDMIGKRDSAFFFIEKLEPLVEKVKSSNKIWYYNNIGIFYMRNRNHEKAEMYLDKVSQQKQIPEVYATLAVISGRNGDMNKAKAYWEQALTTKNMYSKVSFLNTMYVQYGEKAMYKEAFDLSRVLFNAKDSLLNAQQTTEIRELQLKYDQKVTEERFNQIIFIAIVIIIFMIAFGIVFMLRSAQKSREASNAISRSQTLIDSYQRQINQMQNSGDEAAKEIRSLEKKISILQENQTKILSHGKELYNSLQTGGKTLMWSKEDFKDFVEFYKVIDLTFSLQLDSDYVKLTPNNKTLLILQNMGKSDEEIQQIMSISNGSLRTARSRIKAKMKN